MPIEVKQTWWHIEEIYVPIKGRKIRQIMDIFTDTPDLEINALENCNFVGLKAFARNGGNKELPFLERKDDGHFSMVLNLDPLSDFPLVPSIFLTDTRMRHVKIEIEYILTDPQIDETTFWRRNPFCAPERTSTQTISGLIQPEFYFTLPKGWIVAGDIEGDAVKLGCVIQQNSVSPKKIIFEDVVLNSPFIKFNDENKKVYYYLANNESFNNLLNKIGAGDNVNFLFSYKSRLCDEIVGIALFRYVLAFIATAALLNAVFHYTHGTPFIFDCNFGLALLVLLMGYAYYYGNLVSSGHEIPHRNWFIFVFALCIIAIFVIILISITSGNGTIVQNVT